jgi:hypothetical protein
MTRDLMTAPLLISQSGAQPPVANVAARDARPRWDSSNGISNHRLEAVPALSYPYSTMLNTARVIASDWWHWWPTPWVLSRLCA